MRSDPRERHVRLLEVAEHRIAEHLFAASRLVARVGTWHRPRCHDNQVREAITAERSPKEREAYLQTLRNDAYVKVADNYRASVEPLLNIVPPAAATKRTKPSKKDKKDKNEKQP